MADEPSHVMTDQGPPGQPTGESTSGVAAALHRLALVAWGCLAYAVVAVLGVAQLVQWGSPDVGWLVWWACSLAAALTGLVGCGVAAVVLRAFVPAGRSRVGDPTDELGTPGTSTSLS
ncbi:MAG: hypothetical protein ACTHQ3_10455 [Motilibacteraceae bacterium]